MLFDLKNLIKITDRKSALKALALSVPAMAVLFIILGLLCRIVSFFFWVGYSVFYIFT